MTARADAAARTGEAILAAAAEVFWEDPRADLNLDAVAERANVSVRTVLRRFGSKEGLLTAAGEREMRLVGEQRGQAHPGDVNQTVGILLDHYEVYGPRVLKLLGAEASSPALRERADAGRQIHRQWCQEVFAPQLAAVPTRDRPRRLAQLVAICDVQTWRLLRHDARLSRQQTHLALVEMITSLTKES